MKVCPKCHLKVGKNDKFCTWCGYSLQAAHRRKMFIVSGIIIFLIMCLAFLVYRSFKLEQEYMKPFSSKVTCYDNICNVIANYDRKNKIITTNIEINQKIEQWQKEVTPKNSKGQLMFILSSDENNQQDIEEPILSYESKPIELTVGSLLNVRYEISNTNLKDFVTFKKRLQSGFTLDLPMSISTIKNNRQFAKDEYLAEKERKRQQAAKAAQAARVRSQLYNMFYNPYSYGYYY